MKRISELALILLFLLLTLFFGRPIIEGDGISYYALTLSLVRDHDFDLENQKKEIARVMAPIHPVTGEHASLFSCGFAILYAPLLAASDWLMQWFPSLSQLHPYAQNTKFPFVHAVSLFVTSGLFSIVTMVGTFKLIIQRYSLSKWASAILCTIVFIGTPMLFYSVSETSYSHSADAFLTFIAVALALSSRPMELFRVRWRNVLLGSILALSVLLRNNNVVLVPSIVFGFLWLQRKDQANLLRVCAEITAGAIPFLIVLGDYNLTQYGKLIATGYKIQTSDTFLLSMLFHPFAGLFIWAPITLLSFAGLLIGSIQKRFEAILSLSCVVLAFATIQFQANWWGGCSFGQRFFTHLFVFWAIGLAQLYIVLKKPIVVLCAFPALWTFFLFNIYLINFSFPEGREVLQKNKCRHTSFEIISSAVQHYDEVQPTNPFSYWLDALSSPPYPTLFSIMRGK